MKKLVFATQVFGLIAMFPIVVILELNHGKRNTTESNSTSTVIQKVEKTNIVFPEKGNDKR